MWSRHSVYVKFMGLTGKRQRALVLVGFLSVSQQDNQRSIPARGLQTGVKLGIRRTVYRAFEVPGKTRGAWSRDAWAGFFCGIYIGGIMPFVLVVARKQLHMSEALIGLMVAAPFIGNLFALFWANAMEGRSKMPFVVWPCIIGRAIFFLMLFVHTPIWYAAIVTSSQFLVTITSPAYASIMKDIYPDKLRGRMMGYVRVLIALANVVTAMIAGRMLSGDGYRFVFPIAAAFGILSTVFFRTINVSKPTVEEIQGKKKTHEFLADAIKILGQDRLFLWFALSVFTYGCGNLLLQPIIPIFQVDKLNFGPKDVSVLTLVFNVFWMFSYLYWGRRVDTSNPLKIIIINILINMMIPLNYIIAGSLGHPTIVALFPSAAALGISAAGIELAYFNAVLRFADPRRISTYMALFSCLLGIRGTLAPFAGAWAMKTFASNHWNIGYLFGITMVLMLLGMMMQIVGMRNERQN